MNIGIICTSVCGVNMIYNRFKSIKSAFIRKTNLNLETTWDDFVVFLSKHHDAVEKEHVELFNLWEFDPNGEMGVKREYVNNVATGRKIDIPNTIKRCKKNALYVHGLVADVDERFTLVEAIDKFKELEFFLYTTFNHTLEHNRFRMVFPFTHKISFDEFETKAQDMQDIFGKADRCTFTVSQAFYYHSGKEDNITYLNKGEFLNPDCFKITPPKVPKPPIVYKGEFDNDTYNANVIDSLNTCSNVRYTSGINLAMLIRSIGGDFSDFSGVVTRIGGLDSQIREESKKHELWDEGCNRGFLCAETRDAFIAQHGGTNYVAIRKLEKQTINDLWEKYKRK